MSRSIEPIASAATNPRPWATWILSALSVLSFLLAARIALVGRWDNLRWFLLMGDAHAQEAVGALSAATIDEGEWWRLLTTLFVHQDFFHLLINVSTFFGFGRREEALWGSGRFASIYLAAGITGAVFALAHEPARRVIGSSASIAGIMASVAAWYFLNRRVLPPNIVRTGIRQSIVAFAWLMGWWALLSWLGGTTFQWVYFLGGALAGVAVAFPLHAQQTLTSPTRWAYWALVPLVPLTGLAALWNTKERGDKKWADAVATTRAARDRQARDAQQRRQRGKEQNEYDRFNQELMPEILKGDRFYEKHWQEIAGILQTAPPARGAIRVAETRQELSQARSEIATALEKLKQTPEFEVDRVEGSARAARRYLEDLDELLRVADQLLAEATPWNDAIAEVAEQTSRSARSFNRSLRAR